MYEVTLDSKIRDYALIPIVVVFLCGNLIRNNLLRLFQDKPKVDMKSMKQNNTLARARSLKVPTARFLCERAWNNKKKYFTKRQTAEKGDGVLCNPPEAVDPMASMAQPDMGQAAGMMKSQMVFIVSQGALGYWVNYLFSGFLVAKTPFPLTFRFKSMLQRGVEVENLEAGYISGLCWYFMIMMAIGGIQQFITSLWVDEDEKLADPNGQDEMMMMMGMPPPGMGHPMMQGPDPKKIYKQEEDSLNIHYFETCLEHAEMDLWKKWKKDKMKNK